MTASSLVRILAPLIGGAAVLAWRLEETRSPVTLARIVLPPLGMSTGLAMFAVPAMRIPWSWAVVAFLTGALVLGHVLSRTSSLERRGSVVWMRRSNRFVVLLLGLLTLRLLLHDWIDHLLPPAQTASVFFLLAFGMIVRWRVGLYRTYRRIVDRGGAEP